MALRGRPKGVKNKATEFIKPIAQRHGPDIINKMMNIVRKSKVEANQIKAAELVMAYGYGKPSQAVELSGKDGGPIVSANVAGIDQAILGIVQNSKKEEGLVQ